MRFLTRSLTGLALLMLTLGLLALAMATLRSAIAERAAATSARPPPAERVFAANVGVLAARTVNPVLTAYGDLQSVRRLELHAATRGTLIALAPGFRDGGRVRAGEMLYRIDPADAETALALAKSDLAAAGAEVDEAAGALEPARDELVVAERQRALRAQALARARDLRGRGVGSEADRETAEIALAVAEQVVTVSRRALAAAEARVARAAIARNRAAIARDEAARELGRTEAVASFDGVLTEVSAVLGRLVTENERLGLLIDPAALEVAFRVSNAEFARLTGADGGLRPLAVTASLEIDGIELGVPGRIDRAGASTGAGQTGRLIYATLDPGGLELLRPGDFLTVRVAEPPMANVAEVPAAALSPEGWLLVLGSEGRLEAAPVTVLRRQGDTVIVADAPYGRTYVTERQPQLGPGIRVRPTAPPAAAPRAADAMVRLSPERRAGLIAAVEADAQLSRDAKVRLLAALEADEVPQSMIDRLEPRTGG